MNHIIGLDPSFTATGVAKIDGESVAFRTLPPARGTGLERAVEVRENILSAIYPGCAMVVIEGLAFSRNDPSSQERAFLHYSVREHLKDLGIACYVVPPTTLKKFVTGKGVAEKNLMLLEVYKRWGISANNDNEADSIGLAMIGACIAGQRQPATAAQREALDAILNPKPKKAKKARA